MIDFIFLVLEGLFRLTGFVLTRLWMLWIPLLVTWLFGIWPFGQSSSSLSVTPMPAASVAHHVTQEVPMIANSVSPSGGLDLPGMFVAGSLMFYLLLLGLGIALSVLQELKKPYLGASSIVAVFGTMLICASNGGYAILVGNPLKLLLFGAGFVAAGVWWAVWGKHNLRRRRWRTAGVDAVYFFNVERGIFKEGHPGVVADKVPHHLADEFRRWWSNFAYQRGLPSEPYGYQGRLDRLTSDAIFWPFGVLATFFRDMWAVVADKASSWNKTRLESATAQAAAADQLMLGGTASQPSANGGRRPRSYLLPLFLISLTFASCGGSAPNEGAQLPEASAPADASKPGLLEKAGTSLVDLAAKKAKEMMGGKNDTASEAKKESIQPPTPVVETPPAAEASGTTSTKEQVTSESMNTSPKAGDVQQPSVLPQEQDGTTDPASSSSDNGSLLDFFKLSSWGSWLLFAVAFVLVSLFAGARRPLPYRAGFVVFFSAVLFCASNGWSTGSGWLNLGIVLGVTLGLIVVGVVWFEPFMFNRVIRRREEAIQEIVNEVIRAGDLRGPDGALVKDLSNHPKYQAEVRRDWPSRAHALGFPVDTPHPVLMRTERITWILFFPFIAVRLLVEDLLIDVWQNCIKKCRRSFERREEVDRLFFNALIEQPSTAAATPTTSAT